MLTESIIRLKIAFSHLTMNGLFFWEGLLFLDDAKYKEIVEEKFTNMIASFPTTEKEAISYYQEIFEDFKKVRKDVLDNVKTRAEVEKIRESLISKAAHEAIIDIMRNSLEKTQGA